MKSLAFPLLLYFSARFYIFGKTEEPSPCLQDTAAKIASIYQAKGVEITEAQALDEATADMAGEMLQDGALLDDFLDRNRGNKTLLQKVRDIFRAIIDKLTGAEKRRAQSAEGKLTAALEAAAGNVQDFTTETADGGAEYQIKTLPDGKQYVQADRQVIFGNDPESWSQQLEDYINGKIRGGENVQLVAADGDVLTLTADTAGKVSSQFRGDGTRLSDEEFERKVDAGVYIDELAQVSRSQGKRKADEGGRHGEFASQGWDYRDAYFRDLDGKYYQVTISAAVNDEGKIVYNIGKMRKRDFPNHTGSSTKGGAQGVEKVSPSSRVSQQDGDVKPKYSLKDMGGAFDIEALRKLAQEMSASPQPREIPHRPVQQSPQEILSQLAREVARDSLQGGALDGLSDEDIIAMLEEIARGQGSDAHENVPKKSDKEGGLYSDQKSLDEERRCEAEATIQEAIRRGDYALTIIPEKQAPHMSGTAIPGRSVVTIPMEELQEIAKAKAGSGEIKLIQGTLAWKHTEIVDAGKEIGYTVNLEGVIIKTRFMKIHYRKAGIHIVPYSGEVGK